MAGAKSLAAQQTFISTMHRHFDNDVAAFAFTIATTTTIAQDIVAVSPDNTNHGPRNAAEEETRSHYRYLYIRYYYTGEDDTTTTLSTSS